MGRGGAPEVGTEGALVSRDREFEELKKHNRDLMTALQTSERDSAFAQDRMAELEIAG